MTFKYDEKNPTETKTISVNTTFTFNIISNPDCEATNMRTNTVFPNPVIYALKDEAFNLDFDFQFDSNICTYKI